MQAYNVKKNQNIFDVAIAVHGSVEGVFDLMVNNEDLSFATVLQEGDVIYWDEDFVIYDSIVSALADDNIVPVNGERNVYYKPTNEPLICCIQVSADDSDLTLTMAGDGNMIVDWGDNTELETIALQPTTQKYKHYFDNLVGNRIVKLYGSFNLKTWDMSPINGALFLMQPLIVDEIISKANSIPLQGLLLCKGTYLVDLEEMEISTLEPIQDMSLSDLQLINNTYPDDDVLNNYLIYLAKNNNERRNCRVVLDVQPSGEYKEPDKDSNGNYVITTGMEAIYVITHEAAWNESGPWQFIINDTVYSGEES
jgi:hypothetical protein